MGFNNRGAEAAAARLTKLRRRAKRGVIGVNIGKSRVVDVADATADYVRSATLLAPLADYLVVNVSSPNTPGLRGLQAVETLRPLLEAVRDAAGSTPLLVKIAPDLADDEVTAVAQPRRRSRTRGPHRDEHDDLARGPRHRPGRRRRRGGGRAVGRARSRRVRSPCCASCARRCRPRTSA